MPTPMTTTMAAALDGRRPGAQRFGQWLLERLAGLAPCR